MKISRPQYGLEEQILQTIYRLRDKKSSQIFREPVDGNAVKDYYEKIKEPMDLTTIGNKLKEGKYKKANEVKHDLELIIANCFKFNSQPGIVKKGQQFDECIKTEWGNFEKEIHKKKININDDIKSTDDIKNRLNLLQEKKKRKKIPSQVSLLQTSRKSQQASFLPPIAEVVNLDDKPEGKNQFPSQYVYHPEVYANLTSEQKRDKLKSLVGEHSDVQKDFDAVAERKLRKYRKILHRKVMWIEERIIQKCLEKKRFKKMQLPNHLSNLIENGQIAKTLQVRKLQMYVKQVAYWVEQYAHILSDAMKERFVEACRNIKRCIIRVLRYSKAPRNSRSLIPQNVAGEGQPGSVHPNEDHSAINQSRMGEDRQSIVDDETKTYQSKMKEFRRMLLRDRGQSTKRDTKIMLKHQNGQLVCVDWNSESIEKRNRKRQWNSNVVGMFKYDQAQQNEDAKNNLEKKEEKKRDEEFISQYTNRSNEQVVLKYREKLQIDWDKILLRKFNINMDPPSKNQQTLSDSIDTLFRFDFQPKTSFSTGA